MRRLVTGGLIAVAVALGVACSGGGGDVKSSGIASLSNRDEKTQATTTTTINSEEAILKFARCMREHGIDMPDPDVDGGRFRMRLNADPESPAFQEAEKACEQYRPRMGGADGRVPADVQDRMLKMAQCMRRHGINMPDPQPGQGLVIRGESGIDPDDPTFQAAQRECAQEVGLPGPGERRRNPAP